MSWTSVVQVLIVWWAVCMPLAIIVGRLLRRAGSAYPVDPGTTASPVRTAGTLPQLDSASALSA